MSELKILMLLEEDSNKGYYISCVQMSKYEVKACINDQSVPDRKISWLGTAQVSNKI